MKERKLAIDGLRVLAAIAIILIHVVAASYWEISTIGYKNWIITAGMGWMMTAAVPIFVMISGYLLLNSDNTTDIRRFYKRRVERVVVPLLFWNLIYFLANNLQGKQSLDWGAFFHQLWHYGTNYHLYFLNVLLGLYLITPWLKSVIKSDHLSWLIPLLICGSAIYHFGYGFWGWNRMDNVFNLFIPDLGFYLAGYWIGRREKQVSVTKYITFAVLIMVISIFITRKLVFIFETHEQDTILVSRLSLTVALVAMLVFRATSGIKNSQSKILLFLSRFSGLSMGMYLIHPLLIRLLIDNVYQKSLMASNYWLWFGLLLSTAVTLSITSAWIMTKIPILKKMV